MYLLYVDNILVVVKDKSKIKRLKVQLSGEFEMKNLRIENKILEMKIYKYISESRLIMLILNKIHRGGA